MLFRSSDGGEDVRQVQYLHPNSEHIIDWFHITMWLTVLQQQTQALQTEQPASGNEVSKQIDSVKHLLWHGNVDEGLDRLGSLFLDLDLMRKRSPPAEKLATGVAEFETYIRNNRESIPNFGERYRQGETIRPGGTIPGILYAKGYPALDSGSFCTLRVPRRSARSRSNVVV